MFEGIGVKGVMLVRILIFYYAKTLNVENGIFIKSKLGVVKLAQEKIFLEGMERGKLRGKVVFLELA